MNWIYLVAIALVIVFATAMNTTPKAKPKRRQERNQPKTTQNAPEAKDSIGELPIRFNEQNASSRPQYRDKFQLLNKSEQVLYTRLAEAVPAMLVFSQVSMSQVFHINGRTKDGYRQLGEVGRKSIDFLLCRPDDTSIVLAIELNGPTHETERQKASDEKKQLALEQAGIPLLILTPDELPDVATLRKVIAPHIVERKRYEAERNERIQSAPRR